MPKPYPPEFRRDVVAVARKHEAPLSQIGNAVAKSVGSMWCSCVPDAIGAFRFVR